MNSETPPFLVKLALAVKERPAEMQKALKIAAQAHDLRVKTAIAEDREKRKAEVK